MDKMKGNGFVVGISVVSVAIVGAFVYLVLGAWNAAGQAEGSVLSKRSTIDGLGSRNDIPGDRWCKSAEEYETAAKTEYSSCLKFYREADKRLERWFEKLDTQPEGLPSQGDLKTELATGINGLKTMLQGASIEVGYPKAAATGFGAASGGSEEQGGFVLEDPTADSKTDMKTMMKHFWIQKHIAETARAAKVVRLEKITFPPPKIESGGAGTTPEQARLEAIGLPHNLGIYFQFRVELLSKNEDVPVFLARLFEYDPKTSYCLRIRDWTITQTKEALAALPDRKSVDVPETDKDTWTPPPTPVQTIRLSVTGDVLDFEIKDTEWKGDAGSDGVAAVPAPGQ
ncbi:MAG: hypothetical protein HYY93_06665 [Planctomycetes bacterium]|nr:hypothetical protein [Planctomycetota bacterium]